MAAPIIATPRLLLRGHRPDDLAPRMAIFAEPETLRFLGGTPQGREEGWARIQRYAGHWALLGWGLWAVEEAGRLVGEVGFGRFERGLGEEFDRCPEAAWVLGRAAVGRGLAGEAMTAALDWAATRFGPQRLVCVVDPGNAASLALAARLGFRPYRDARYRDKPAVLLERPALASTPAPR